MTGADRENYGIVNETHPFKRKICIQYLYTLLDFFYLEMKRTEEEEGKTVTRMGTIMSHMIPGRFGEMHLTLLCVAFTNEANDVA